MLLNVSVLRLFPVPPMLSSCTGNKLLHSSLPVLRLFSSRCGHRASPAPRAVRSPTAQFIIVSVLRLFPSRLVLPSRASTEPTAQFSYPLVVTVGGRIRPCYQSVDTAQA